MSQCSLLSYLERISPKARGLGDQVIPIITTYRSDPFIRIPAIQAILDKFPDHISRRSVVKLFEGEDLYLASVAALIWGGINATRPTSKGGGAETTNLSKFLSVPQDAMLDRLEKIKILLDEEDFEKAYIESSTGGSTNISGLGPAYFTKLFFFLGQASELSCKKPLILDKWTTNAFLILLQLEGEYDIEEFGTLTLPIGIGSVGASKLKGGFRKKAKTYQLFCKKMDDWASVVDLNASQLEQYLFGDDLKRNRLGDNPRVELWTLARECLSKQ